MALTLLGRAAIGFSGATRPPVGRLADGFSRFPRSIASATLGERCSHRGLRARHCSSPTAARPTGWPARRLGDLTDTVAISCSGYSCGRRGLGRRGRCGAMGFAVVVRARECSMTPGRARMNSPTGPTAAAASRGALPGLDGLQVATCSCCRCRLRPPWCPTLAVRRLACRATLGNGKACSSKCCMPRWNSWAETRRKPMTAVACSRFTSGNGHVTAYRRYLTAFRKRNPWRATRRNSKRTLS